MLNRQYEQVIIEKLRALPPERVAEVEDFLDFLQTRTEAHQLTRAAGTLAEGVFSKVWDKNSGVKTPGSGLLFCGKRRDLTPEYFPRRAADKAEDEYFRVAHLGKYTSQSGEKNV